MAVETLVQATQTESLPHAIDVPAPTAWPMVLAFGVTLACTGLVTSAAVSALGCISAAIAAVGWFREVLPVEARVPVPVEPPPPPVVTRRADVRRVHVDVQRAWLPLEIYPVSAGIKGGVAGSVAMAALAMLFGVISRTSIWYPINLLAAGFLWDARFVSTSELAAFHASLLVIAIVIHAITSLLVGLLYGALLPVLARRPIFLGGLIAPLVWSGLLASILNIVNPVLNRRIDWLWFALSQVAFGVVAGLVVSRQERVRTWQAAPLTLRIGVEAPGIIPERRGDTRGE